MQAENLAEVLRDQAVAEVVDRYLSPPGGAEEARAAQRYPLYAARLSAKRFVMPVAGVQGSGKSTLLNALAFDRPVLPVDADETTCVPVEIRWSANPSDLAQVVLLSGETLVVPADEKTLAQYVHNQYNPGNAKGVDRIIVETGNSLFSTGVVLVDLPGTGSLTKANLETTRRYLEEAVGVLFMLRTVPPLTLSESVFVAMQWARLPVALFVQNRWTDESDEEAESGREHNVRVLMDLARRNRIPVSGPEVEVVCAYSALQGRWSMDDSLVRESGLPALLDALGSLGGQWPQRLLEEIHGRLVTELDHVRVAVESRLHRLAADDDTVRTEMAGAQARFDGYLAKIRERKAAAVGDTEEYLQRQNAWLAGWSDKNRAELRNKMRTKMRSGIVDGPRLERALRDEQAVLSDEIFLKVEEDLMAFQDLLRERFGDLKEWSLGKECEFESVRREERVKWENLGHLAGGAGGAWGGAEFGAWLGFAVGGPVGAIVGGAVGGLLGGFLGSWAGGKGREYVTDDRAKAAESEVFKVIDAFTQRLSRSIEVQLKEFCAHLWESVEVWEREQVHRFEIERQATLEILAAGVEERERLRWEAERDLGTVTCYLGRLQRKAL